MRMQQGFTLIELLIVIAIVGILSAVAFLSLRRDTPQVREAARILAADLMRARTEAIRLNTAVALRINTTSNSYAMFADATCDGTSDNGTTLMQRSINGDFPLANLTTTSAATDLNHADYRICFDVRGLPRSGGNLFLTIPVSIKSKQDSNYKLAVKVSSQGRIEVAQ